VFDISDVERMRIACEIRTRVFVDEQGVPPEEEIDEHDRSDRDAVHVIVRAPSGAAVGAGRFYVTSPDTVQIGRMAVLPEARGTGAGAALLRKLMSVAAQRGFARAHLHAQTHARGFYAKAGFADDGEPLWDAGIEHIPMSSALS
jgi:predicted GNAT family N-acyltransferase